MPSREALSTFASNFKDTAVTYGSWAFTEFRTRASSAWESARPQISAFSVKAFDFAWNNKAAVISATAAAGLTLSIVRLWDRAFPTDAAAAARAEVGKARQAVIDAEAKAARDVAAAQAAIASQLEKATAETNQAAQVMAFASNRMQEMKKTLAESDKQIQTLKEGVAALDARNGSLEAQLAAVTETRDALIAGSPERNRALGAAEEKADLARAELERIKQQSTALLNNAREENEALTTGLAALRAELSKQQESSERLIAEWTTKVTTLREQLDGVFKERNELHKDHKEAEGRITALTAELDGLKGASAEDKRAADQSIKDLTAQIATLTADLGKTREEAAAAGKTADERIEALTAQIEALTADRDGLKEAAEDASAKASDGTPPAGGKKPRGE